MNQIYEKEETLSFPICNEKPNINAPIEWWFVHSNFSSGKELSGHFMFSLFRHNISEKSDCPESCYTLLFRLEDSMHDKPFVVSMGDNRIRELLKSSEKILLNSNINREILQTYLEETEKYGFVSGISCSKSPVKFSGNKLDFSWQDFSLKEHNGKLIFSFKNPWDNEIVEFTADSKSKRFDLSDEKMAYITYPFFDIQGKYNGFDVSGNAWFDHQWGGLGWFFSEQKKSGELNLLGWDWFGINFDNGTAGILLSQRDMKTREKLRSRFVLMEKDGLIKEFNNLKIEPLRYWYSSKTGIYYPVEWKITIPEYKAELFFAPLKDDQEIPVLGITRNIWEGAGNISGVINGKVVSGTARLELNGYGYVFDVSEVMNAFSQRVSSHIKEFFPENPDEKFFCKHTGIQPEKGNVETIRKILSEPIWDMLNRGGKFWRPIFGILLLESLSLDSKKYEDLMSVTSELAHLASLIIDDIEDNAQTRRNDKCIHLKYGTDVAINAANTLYFLPILKLKENKYISDKQALQIYEKAMEFFVRAHFGQGMDIAASSAENFLQNKDLDTLIKDSLNIYALKSGASVEFIAYTACILANADKKTTNKLLDFARSFGVAFQIKDDIHDFADNDKWTKEPGSDLSNGKLTYVILIALQELKSENLKFIKDLICKKIPTSKENIDRGIKIIRSSNVLKKANDKIFCLINESWKGISEVLPQSNAKIMLKVMCDYLLKLDYMDFDITL